MQKRNQTKCLIPLSVVSENRDFYEFPDSIAVIGDSIRELSARGLDFFKNLVVLRIPSVTLACVGFALAAKDTFRVLLRPFLSLVPSWRALILAFGVERACVDFTAF